MTTWNHLVTKFPVRLLGKETQWKINKTSPDLVLMNIMLEGRMDCVEAAQQILEHHVIPIIIFYRLLRFLDTRRAKLSETFGYLIKPYKEWELHVTLEITFCKHKMEKLIRESMKADLIHWLGVRSYRCKASQLNRTVGFLNGTAWIAEPAL